MYFISDLITDCSDTQVKGAVMMPCPGRSIARQSGAHFIHIALFDTSQFYFLIFAALKKVKDLEY